jgi:phage terminase large subunit GpA-like protein
MLMAIDTGSLPQPVYDFAARHHQPIHTPEGHNVYSPHSVVAVKGTDDPDRIIVGHSKEDAAKTRQDVSIVRVGTHYVKNELMNNLRHVLPDGDTPVANCCHFPDYTFDYFQGLCSERRVVKGAKTVWEKKNNVRNEPLDCRVYARAAAYMCNLDKFTAAQWDKLEAKVGMQKPAQAQQAPQPQSNKPRTVARFW